MDTIAKSRERVSVSKVLSFTFETVKTHEFRRIMSMETYFVFHILTFLVLWSCTTEEEAVASPLFP